MKLLNSKAFEAVDIKKHPAKYANRGFLNGYTIGFDAGTAGREGGSGGSGSSGGLYINGVVI